MFTYCDALEIEQRLPRMDVVTFLDPAISQKQEADFTAIVTVGFDPTNNYAYLLEAKQLKETPDNVISELFQTVTKYRNAGKSYRAGIETVQYQKMLAMEILKRYYFQKGQVEYTLRNDKDLDIALDLLNNETKYNQILKK